MGDVMKEKSCGAIIYKTENNELKFLLVHQSNGHYSFPKGHMEEGENEIDTALREIKEETNIDVNLDTDFRKSISYLLESKNVIKEAVYFVATPITENLKAQAGEIDDCSWNNYEETLEKLEFDNIKEVFEEAYNYLKKIGIDK